MQRSLKPQAVSAFVACLMLFLFSAQALSGTITSWGYDYYDQVTNTPLDTNFTAIAAGVSHSLALKSDGSIISWGYDGHDQVTNTPSGTDFTAIAGGGYHSLALKSDGSLISWGYDDYNQVTLTPSGTDFAAIAGGGYHSMALSVSVVPLPTSAWMGLVLLGGIGGYGLIRRKLCSVNTPL